jgi:DNA gyrase/topoisomerase IV subunit A
MMVTDAGRLIRVPVDQARVTGRQAMGVTLFRVDKGEHVTSVFTVLEEETEDTAVLDDAVVENGPDDAVVEKRQDDAVVEKRQDDAVVENDQRPEAQDETAEGTDDNEKPVSNHGNDGPEEGSDG